MHFHSGLSAFTALLIVVNHVSCQTSETRAPSATSTASDVPQTSIFITPTPTITFTTAPVLPTLSFPSGIPHDYSDEGLEELWSIVGSVQSPPITSTVVPQTPIILPSPPPQIVPDFYARQPKDILPHLKFPKGFKFGVSTASYQVEGATKSEGKGPTMWDWASRQPAFVADNTTADISTLHYYLYKEDVARVAALGLDAHSFSVSWARIFPFGTADSPLNQAGLDHYSDAIDYHIELGLEPAVTLFHWDLPLALSAYYGGFTSPKIVDDFVHYAKTIFKAFNGRVKTWFTFNEPRVYCGQATSYPFNASLAEGLNSSTAFFHCAYYLLKAHAGAVKAFREMGIEGEISLKNDDFIGIPWRANSTEDAEAVERHAAFQIGIFSDPLYTTGDWPKLMTDILTPEWLPRFTDEEKADLLGSADFFAIDSYRQSYIAAPNDGLEACLSDMTHELWPSCNQLVLYDSNFGWAAGLTPDPNVANWLQGTPDNVRLLYRELYKRWPSKKMYVTEYGFCEPFESEQTLLFQAINDLARSTYFMSYLGEMLLSIHEDGVPIAGAFAWAMLDNVEWASGQIPRFGIQYTNYTSLERTYKRSAMMMEEFIRTHRTE